jgi:hypothetical protein
MIHALPILASYVIDWTLCMMYSKTAAFGGLTCIAVAILAACGGGGGGGDTGGGSTSTTSSLSGVAAYGAPLSGATITIIDSTGKSVTATAGADGSYTANVTGFTAPLLVTATGASGDSVRKYIALVDTAPAAGTSAIANVTPLTNALAALASSDGLSPEEFAKDLTKLQNLDKAKLARALTNLQAALSAVLADAGLPAKFDPTKTPFQADRTSGGDVLLDTIKVSQSSNGVAFTNVRIAIGSTEAGSTATITLTGATTVPPTPLAAPTVAAADVKALDAWTTQVNACLALAPAARVTLAANVYTFNGACAAIPAVTSSYKRNGYNLSQVWGPRFAFIPQGAVAALPEILTFAKNDAGDDIAFIRLAYNSATGGGVYNEVARKINGSWKIDGNQRDFDADTTVALIRTTDVSTNGMAIGAIAGYADSGKNVGKFSSYQSRLFFRFNQAGPNAATVYAVRVKGPGLPLAGVVIAKSSGCGTSNYLALYSNDGSFPSSSILMPTTTTGNGWTMDVKNFGTGYTGTDFYNQNRGINSGTGLPSTSTTSSIAPVALDVSAIPEFARYTWEVFTGSGTTASSTFSSRIVVKPLPASFGGKQPWAELTADALEYAQPTVVSKAGSLAGGAVSWTLPAGAPVVTSAYIDGTVNNLASGPRMNMDSNVATFGATSQAVSAASELDGAGGACTQTTLPAFTASTGGRVVGTRQSTDRSLQLQQNSFHTAR